MSVAYEEMILSADDVDFAKYMDETEMKSKVLAANAFSEEVIDFFHKPTYEHGDKMPFARLQNLVRFRPGEVSVWSGFNGHGKSLLLGQVILGMVQQGRSVCIASMEMQPRTTLSRICRQFTEKRHPERGEINEFLDVVSSHMFLYDHQGVVVADKLLAVLRYCAFELHIKHFVVDSLLKCGIPEDDFNGQKRFVDNLCSIGRDSGMHIHLVCHSRKGKDETIPPGKMDIRGSGSISDQVDNVFCVWKNKDEKRNPGDDALLIVDKQRNGEWEGRIALSFDPEAQGFYEHGSRSNYF